MQGCEMPCCGQGKRINVLPYSEIVLRIIIIEYRYLYLAPVSGLLISWVYYWQDYSGWIFGIKSVE